MMPVILPNEPDEVYRAFHNVLRDYKNLLW